MKDVELVEFIMMLFIVGVFAQSYYPKLFTSLLPIVAFLGAAYFVWGSVAHVTASWFKVWSDRKEDWWNGLAILTIVILIYGQQKIAIQSVVFFFSLIWFGLLKILTLGM